MRRVLLFLVVCQFACSADATVCKGNYFVLSNSKATNQAFAKTACKQSGGVLARVPNSITQYQIASQVAAKLGNGWTANYPVYAYIGGERVGDSFQWQDGLTFSTLSGSSWSTPGYNGWKSGSGPSGSGTCLVFSGTRSVSKPYTYTWKWQDAHCSGNFHYVCQHQADRVLTFVNPVKAVRVESSVLFTGTISQVYLEPLNVAVIGNNFAETLLSAFTGSTITYRIDAAKAFHNGTYKFKATNVSGTCSVEASVQLTVVQPNLILSSSEITANYQASTSVTCTSHTIPKSQNVNWKRNGAVITSNSGLRYYQVHSFSATKMPEATLYFKNVEVILSGKYYCEENHLGIITSKEFTLQVAANISLSPTQWKVPTFPEKFSVDCLSNGWPAPTASWTKNSISVGTSTTEAVYQVSSLDRNFRRTTLHIDAKGLGQLGDYKCTASNIKPIYTVHATFRVQAEANISLSKQAVAVKELQMFNVTCASSGHPLPSLYWTRNSKSVSGSVYEMKRNASQFHVLAILRFSQVKSDQAGIYVCHASNTVSNQVQTSLQKTLTITVQPRFINATSKHGSVFSQTQMFNCTFAADRSTALYWSINDRPVPDNNATSPTYVINHRRDSVVTSQLSLAGAQIFGGNATVKCWAKNQAGTTRTNTLYINEALALHNKQYYVDYKTQRNFTSAKAFCETLGGGLPMSAFANGSSNITTPSTQFWIQPTYSGLGNETIGNASCLFYENSSLTSTECNDSCQILCTFSMVRFTMASDCHRDKIVVKWFDQLKYTRDFDFQLTAQNADGSVTIVRRFSQKALPGHQYSATLDKLPVNERYRIMIQLFPALGALPEAASIAGSTSSLFGKVVARLSMNSKVCKIEITTPNSTLALILSAKLTINQTKDGRHNFSEIPLNVSGLITHEVALDEGQNIRVWFHPSTAHCHDIAIPLIGNCSRPISTNNFWNLNQLTLYIYIGSGAGGLLILILIVVCIVKRNAICSCCHKKAVPQSASEPESNNGGLLKRTKLTGTDVYLAPKKDPNLKPDSLGHSGEQYTNMSFSGQMQADQAGKLPRGGNLVSDTAPRNSDRYARTVRSRAQPEKQEDVYVLKQLAVDTTGTDVYLAPKKDPNPNPDSPGHSGEQYTNMSFSGQMQADQAGKLPGGGNPVSDTAPRNRDRYARTVRSRAQPGKQEHAVYDLPGPIYDDPC